MAIAKLAATPIFLPLCASTRRRRLEKARKYRNELAMECAPFAPTPANNAHGPSFSTRSLNTSVHVLRRWPSTSTAA
jgi:hypothetical protein